MNINEFDYHLPPELIAQTPIEPRDQSRLMILHRNDNSVEHRQFNEIADYLHSGDTLVLNNSKVIPARLSGQRNGSGANIEILLLRHLDDSTWETLVRPGKKAIVGEKIKIDGKHVHNGKIITAEIVEQREGGIRTVRFSDDSLLEEIGEVPLPPYIHTPLTEPGRYQTVYAKVKGSVAAPTAGFHFTTDLIDKLQQKGVRFAFVTLHIGLDTFRPVRVDDPQQHPIHTEYGEVSNETASLLNQTKKEGKRVIAVGTSTVRLVESATQSGIVNPYTGWVNLFILPGYQFGITDAMITNFHLPRTTLLMLVSAFYKKESILQAYEQAKSLNYRFYSFGDCMIIL